MSAPKIIALTADQAKQIAALKSAQISAATASAAANKNFTDYVKTLTGGAAPFVRVQVSDDGKNLIIG